MIKRIIVDHEGSDKLSALLADVEDRYGALSFAGREGKSFVVVPCADPLETIAWALASFYADVALVPVSPAIGASALQEQLLALPKGAWALAGELELERRTLPGAPKSLDAVWAVVFSSGSSGAPKAVAISGNAFCSSAIAHAQHLNLGEHAWLLNLPMNHVGGLSVLMRAFFLGGGIAVGTSKFSAAETFSWICSGKVQGLSLVPTGLHRLLSYLEQPEGAGDVSRTIILVGGDAVSESLLSRAERRGLRVLRTYGMTEFSSQVATEQSVGGGMRPLNGAAVKIFGDEIFVSGPMLASGIYKHGKLNPLTLVNGFFATGDFGSLSADGTITILGRKSDLIISGGVNVYPAEVERFREFLPGVRDLAVTAAPSEEWVEVAVALVEADVAPADFEERWKAVLVEKIDRRKVPKAWFRVDKIPRGENGKILRSELKKLLPKGFVPELK